MLKNAMIAKRKTRFFVCQTSSDLVIPNLESTSFRGLIVGEKMIYQTRTATGPEMAAGTIYDIRKYFFQLLGFRSSIRDIKITNMIVMGT